MGGWNCFLERQKCDAAAVELILGRGRARQGHVIQGPQQPHGGLALEAGARADAWLLPTCSPLPPPTSATSFVAAGCLAFLPPPTVALLLRWLLVVLLLVVLLLLVVAVVPLPLPLLLMLRLLPPLTQRPPLLPLPPPPLSVLLLLSALAPSAAGRHGEERLAGKLHAYEGRAAQLEAALVCAHAGRAAVLREAG